MLEDIYQEGGKIKCIVYNLAHTLKSQLQQNLTKFLICGLPTMDKISHFTLKPSTCQLCKKEKESWTHLLKTCIHAKSYFEKMRQSCIKLKLPSWESSSFVCELTAQYCSNLFTSIVSAALLALWLTVCAEGFQSILQLFGWVHTTYHTVVHLSFYREQRGYHLGQHLNYCTTIAVYQPWPHQQHGN